MTKHHQRQAVPITPLGTSLGSIAVHTSRYKVVYRSSTGRQNHPSASAPDSPRRLHNQGQLLPLLLRSTGQLQISSAQPSIRTSSLIGLPSATEANPHCGLIQILSCHSQSLFYLFPQNITAYWSSAVALDRSGIPPEITCTASSTRAFTSSTFSSCIQSISLRNITTFSASVPALSWLKPSQE